MTINRENYEAFFLDYHEGNLTKGQKEELMDFLQQNIDLKDEFDHFEMIFLGDDVQETIFAGKDLLKRPFDTTIHDTVKEIHLIAWHEGDLNETEKKMVEQTVAEDVNLQKDFNLYGLTRLLPDHSIVYQNKKSLKRYVIGGFGSSLVRIATAAAILGFIATLYFSAPRLFNETQVAEVIPETINPERIPSPIIDELTPLENAIVLPENTPTIQIAESNIEIPAQAIPAVRMNSEFALIEPLGQINISPKNNEPLYIDLREEFYWLTYADGQEYDVDDFTETPSSENSALSKQYTSLASLAYNGIEKTTGFDLQSFEKKVSETRFGFWDLAGIGLAGIGNLTGTSLTIEKERDENGRITTFGIGERFKISR
jgi:hypothetical protein